MVNATAHGKSLVISPKYTFMICQYIRGRKLARAKAILEAAIAGKEAIPFTKFNDGVGHRVGISASGRYPFKACSAVLTLLNSAEANAVNKGLTGELVVTGCRANRASAPMRQGRQSRRVGKRTHVHITLEELESKRVTKKTKITAPETATPKNTATTSTKTTPTETTPATPKKKVEGNPKEVKEKQATPKAEKPKEAKPKVAEEAKAVEAAQ